MFPESSTSAFLPSRTEGRSLEKCIGITFARARAAVRVRSCAGASGAAPALPRENADKSRIGVLQEAYESRAGRPKKPREA
jgi:hypothetical protein